MEQTLGRVDALSNPIGENVCSSSLQLNIQKGVSYAELKALFLTQVGAVLENNCALLESMYNAET